VKDRQDSGLGAELVGGLASAVGDPWSLVNPGKGAAGGLGARLLGGAVAGGAVGSMSELSASQASGKEAHIGAAIAGGAAFGGLLNGLLGKRPGKNSWDVDEGLNGELLGPEGKPTGLPNEQLRLLVPVALRPILNRAAQRAGLEDIDALVGTRVQAYGGKDRGIFLAPKGFALLSFREDRNGDVWKIELSRNSSRQCWDLEVSAVVDVMATAMVEAKVNGSSWQTTPVALPIIRQIVLAAKP